MKFEIKSKDNHKICDIAKDERPRERLIKYGADKLSNSELLAIIIFSGTRTESALSLANRVIALEDGKLGAFSNYEVEEFKKIHGVGDAKACQIAAAIEFGKRVALFPKNKVCYDQPKTLAKYFDDMRHYQNEHMRIALFDIKMHIISTEEVSIGSIDSASANPRDVFSSAIRRGAKGIVLVHNHPSGDPKPSKSDIESTKIIREAGKILGIDVLDHIIIGDGEYYSFIENGLFK